MRNTNDEIGKMRTTVPSLERLRRALLANLKWLAVVALLTAWSGAGGFAAESHPDQMASAEVEALRDPGVQRYALGLARASLERYLRNGHLPPLPREVPAVLKMRRAVIVTMEVPGHVTPRGCRGTLEPAYASLGSEIQHNAVAAATRDKRVAPLSAQELEGCRISLTVVLGMHRLQSLAEHDPDNCGLMARRGQQLGIVLPYEGHRSSQQWAWALRKAGLGLESGAEMLELVAVRFKEPA